MINATVVGVSSVATSHNGGTKVYARSLELVSVENPTGETMFYSVPPFWTGAQPPYVGQSVVIGELQKKMSPHWPNPKWLAREVSSADSIRQYSPNRLQEPTTAIRRRKIASWLDRFFEFCGLRPNPMLLRKA